MDWLTKNFEKWANHSKMPRSQRVKEALMLATKVSAHPATVAELCWSDDPEYITGYVASKKQGYQRIMKLKEYAHEGSRIPFVIMFFVGHLKSSLRLMFFSTIVILSSHRDIYPFQK
jgi:6-carboxyhexanoate--CoA ligase